MKAYRCCERLEHSSTQNNKKIDIKLIFITPIVLYKRFISPLLPNSCRYYPTCSQYMIAAIEKYGIVKGILFGIWRILRCTPFSKGGIDEP